jgi:hypothetical protein
LKEFFFVGVALLLNPFELDTSKLFFCEFVTSALSFLRCLIGDLVNDFMEDVLTNFIVFGLENLDFDNDFTVFIPKTFINYASI